MRKLRAVLILVVLFALAACGGGSDGSESGSEGTVVETAMTDSSIDLGTSTVSSGEITFDVTNNGTVVHEIEVFAGRETELPVDKGVADTSTLTLIDEIEDIIPGGSVQLTLDLEAGDYVIMCNLPGHYALGMVTKLTVSG